MKTEISRDSHQPEKRYTGVYQQQGRMLTDADWNELVEILKDRLKDALKDVVGNKEGSGGGLPRHRALKIIADTGDLFKIQPGHIYVNGMAAEISGNTNFNFNQQQDFPLAPTPAGSYLLYADVWERTITHLMDERLRDKGLHGADTCTRKQIVAQIKWCPNSIDPEQSTLNPGIGNAKLTVTLLNKVAQPDPCDPCAAELEVDSKIGNYLFRVEVHDVKGPADNPSEIILKWSSENAAEQYALQNHLGEAIHPPVDFKSGQWLYEFFDDVSELHNGVHLATGFTPVRGELSKGYPATVPARKFVRRWDGYCKLVKSGSVYTVAEKFDRSQSESTTFVTISGGQFTVNLDALTLLLKLNTGIVAGDYWLADVREAEHKVNDVLITDKTPQGIEHYYLTLAKVIGDVLQNNPEADRKYAFPSLSEMTRLFIAGGDGQEVMPGLPLPQSLRVGVANGEWPVEGATVRFQVEEGGGTLNLINHGKTNADGIAECQWLTGSAIDANYRVKATLVDPDHPGDASKDFDPPVYFYANLVTADQVAYLPACPGMGENTVHSLLATDAPPILSLGADTYYTVKEVLDALLCKLRAKHIPYDPTNVSRWNDINEEEGKPLPDTVQKAIDALLENLHSEDISYLLPVCDTTSYGADTVKKHLVASVIEHDPRDAAGRYRIKSLFDAILCKLDAAKIPYNPSIESARWADIVENRPLRASWVKQFAGSGADNLRGLAMDAVGNIFLAGTFSGVINIGGSTLNSSGNSDIYLAKLNSQGERLWALRIGSTGEDSGQATAVDTKGDVILVASYSGAITINISGVNTTYTSQGSQDILVAKFLGENGSCLWAKSFGGTATDLGYTIALDSSGNIIISGFFSGQINFGGETLESIGMADIFLVKLATGNGTPLWVKNYGNTGFNVGYHVAVDADNHIVLTGFFQQTIQFGESVSALVSKGKSDIFVARFNSDGECYWSKKFGGTQSDYGRGLTLDGNGNIYLTGYYQKKISFGSESEALHSADGYDIYIAKLSKNGQHLWSRSFPGTAADYGHAISITTDGTVVIAGYFSGQINFGGDDLNSAGGTDGFLAFLSADATHIHSEALGAGSADQAMRLVSGLNNKLVVAGTFSGNVNIAGQSLNSAAPTDVFIVSLSPPVNGPLTVQAAIDTLLSELESSDIGYQLPPCTNTVDSIRKRLPSIKNLPNGAHSTLREILNTLLCELDASTIPFNGSSDVGSLLDGFVVKTGDTMTGQLVIDDTTADLTQNLLNVEGAASIKGSATLGENNHRAGKIRLWQENNNADAAASHAIGTEPFHNIYGAGTSYPNSIGHKFYRGGGELIAQIGFGGSSTPANRLNAFFSGNVGIDVVTPVEKLEVKGNVKASAFIGDGSALTGISSGKWSDGDLAGKIHYSTGNVGIGIANPAYKLDVRGAISGYLASFQNNLAGSTGTSYGLNISGNAGNATINSSGVGAVIVGSASLAGGTGYGSINYSYSYGTANGYAVYAAAYGSSTGSKYAFYGIGDGYFSGNVGIKTTTPGYALHTNGTSYALSRAGAGIDYAEYFESAEPKKIPVGFSVVLDKGKIRTAKKGEIPIGIISANPIIVGGVHPEWPKKYLRDEFGALIMENFQKEIMVPKKETIKKERQKVENKIIKEEVTQTKIVFEKKKYIQKQVTEVITREEEMPVFEEVDVYDEKGKAKIGRHKIPVMETYEEEIEVMDKDGLPMLTGSGKFVTEQRPKINPDYDESQEYVSREKRPEWNCVGLLGQLALRKGQVAAPGWIKISDISDEVELWLVK